MEPMPTRYVQKPPQVEALLITSEPEVIDAACTWLGKYGRTAFRDTAALVVMESPNAPGFEVPFGAYLVRGTAFARVDALEFEARFESATSHGAHSWKDQL